MPKKATESRVTKPDTTLNKTQKKSERSHEENQERAYIAASRRADRSIEARVQSARMASEIHKKRTGKSFRITEDIVIKEEMYEEEDDDFPRSYRLLGPHMQTGSDEMNSRLEAFLTNKIAMSQYVARGGEAWEKENEINKLFAESFPNLDAQAKALSQSLSRPNYNNGAGTSQARNETNAAPHHSHPQSPLSPVSPTFQHPPPSVTYQRNDSSDLSPPALTPGSPTSRATPSFSMPGPMDFGGSSSAFTTDLSNETRMMFAGLAPGGTQDFYSQTSMFDPSLSMDWMGNTTQQPQYYDPKLERVDAGVFDHSSAMQSPMQWDPTLGAGNAQANDDDWNDFINDQPWGETQAQ